ncbi:MAG: hypothetical protein IT470_04470 [Pseudomonadales bacterium]|nr:hypothetical protein [Pseudomonadales bacterium]
MAMTARWINKHTASFIVVFALAIGVFIYFKALTREWTKVYKFCSDDYRGLILEAVVAMAKSQDLSVVRITNEKWLISSASGFASGGDSPVCTLEAVDGKVAKVLLDSPVFKPDGR